MAGYTSMYGRPYPFEALPDLSLVPHQENDHPRLLTEEERDVLQCMYLWVQSGLKVYRGKNIVNDIPSCTVPSYGEVWWIVQMYQFLTEMPKPQGFIDRHREEYNQLCPPMPKILGGGPVADPASDLTFNVLAVPNLGFLNWRGFSDCLNNALNQIRLNVYFENNLVGMRSAF